MPPSHMENRMRLMQEKCQIVVSARKEGGEPWASFQDARDSGQTTSDEMNCLPAGTDISNQENREINEMSLVLPGTTDYSKVTPTNWERGYRKLTMPGGSDLEETTAMYDDDAGGFVERNNYMDRA